MKRKRQKITGPITSYGKVYNLTSCKYPEYTVRPENRWYQGRVLLIGKDDMIYSCGLCSANSRDLVWHEYIPKVAQV